MPDSVLVSTQDGIPEPPWIARVEPFVRKAMEQLGFDGEEVSILFCTDEFMRNLNNQYRHIDSATDILSFEDGGDYEDENGRKWKNAGDIVISLETLPVNAAYFGTCENDELKRLVVHGLLHLNGMDHGEEHIEKGSRPVCDMLVLQEKVLAALKDEQITAG